MFKVKENFVSQLVVQVIEEEKLQENSLTIGNYFLKGLDELRSKYKIIGDVRGQVQNYSKLWYV